MLLKLGEGHVSPPNYRPVSLRNYLGKISEQNGSKILDFHLRELKAIRDNKYADTSGYSKIRTLLTSTEIITHSFSRNKII
jgi:hypothetical protein